MCSYSEGIAHVSQIGSLTSLSRVLGHSLSALHVQQPLPNYKEYIFTKGKKGT